MGERKVLNKYYPPDFDPAKVPRRKMPKDRQYVVRLMAPFNMRCKKCGDYIYKGKKFNARKETVLDEDYLGLHIFRFYIRCVKCCAPITFKTDPKNTDYVCESGATRNFENWRVVDDVEEAAEKQEELEEQNPMKALEERTKESKAQMDIMDALEEIKELSDKAAMVDIDQLIAAKQDAKEKLLEQRRLRLEEEDDAKARAVFAKRKAENQVRRLDSSDEEGGGEAETLKRPKKEIKSFLSVGKPVKKVRELKVKGLKLMVKKKTDVGSTSCTNDTQASKPQGQSKNAASAVSTPKPKAGGLGLGLDYTSSEDDEG